MRNIDPEKQEAWLRQMDKLRETAAQAALIAQSLGALTAKLVGRDNVPEELLSAGESALGWANRTRGPRNPETTLAEYLETTRNSLHEAVWILDLAREALETERPAMLGDAPAWVGRRQDAASVEAMTRFFRTMGVRVEPQARKPSPDSQGERELDARRGAG